MSYVEPLAEVMGKVQGDGTVPPKLICRGAKCLKIDPNGVLKNRDRFTYDKRYATLRREFCKVCEDLPRPKTTQYARDGRKRAMLRALEAPEAVKPELPAVRAAKTVENVFVEIGALVAENEKNLHHMLKPDVFAAVIAQRRDLYAISGLDAVYDLALMSISDNSMMMQVKLLAAKTLIALRDDGGSNEKDGKPLDAMLSEMNKSFHQNAQRIRSVRSTTTEMTLEPQEQLVVAEQPGDAP